MRRMKKNIRGFTPAAKNLVWGFTLVELIIIVTLISALVLLGIIYLRTQIFKGNDARRKSDLARLKVAVEEYEKDHNCYPFSQIVSCATGDPKGSLLQPYLNKIPCDPITKAPYYYEHEDSVCPTWYRFYALLENEQDEDVTENIGPFGSYNFEVSSSNSPSAPASEATPSPTGGQIIPSEYYGCRSGVCTAIGWDTFRPGPECDPNYQSSTCYNQCSLEFTECVPWQ